ncbi:MAG: c-type cytochrome [Saprospiraceae bacterium]|nr:c-type cytochrome [Saprospiraceae bacterium]
MSEHPELAAASDRQLRILAASRYVLWIFVGIMTTGGILAFFNNWNTEKQLTATQRQSLWPKYDPQTLWKAPDIYLAETDDQHELIAYGRDLIAHTQDYFGENGLVRAGSINGLNCQSCHLDAGSRPWGNNYFAVNSTYPQMRARSGSLETIPKRINDCFQRSLNGQPLDTTSREMRAMMAYMEWLGTGIPKGQKPKGAGLVEVPFLDRPADPVLGQHIYAAKCASCHGADGQGLPMPDVARDYPPLWGEKSYNEGAGLFRMSRLAGYVKANMPFGATFDNPQLSDEEAWDVAAFINSQPRPKHPFLQTDWPKIEKKPYDHPFGPFADSFPEAQHKYGPFGPVVAFYKK